MTRPQRSWTYYLNSATALQRASEELTLTSVSSEDSPVLSMIEDSLASRIASRRQDSARRRGATSADTSPPGSERSESSISRRVTFGPLPKQRRLSKEHFVRINNDDENKSNQALGDVVRRRQKMAETSTETSVKGKSSAQDAILARGRRASVGTINVLSGAHDPRADETAKLSGIADEQLRLSAEYTQSADEMTSDSAKDVESRLGEVMRTQGDLRKLMKDWDRNGDGTLKKMDFRLGLSTALLINRRNVRISR